MWVARSNNQMNRTTKPNQTGLDYLIGGLNWKWKEGRAPGIRSGTSKKGESKCNTPQTRTHTNPIEQTEGVDQSRNQPDWWVDVEKWGLLCVVFFSPLSDSMDLFCWNALTVFDPTVSSIIILQQASNCDANADSAHFILQHHGKQKSPITRERTNLGCWEAEGKSIQCILNTHEWRERTTCPAWRDAKPVPLSFHCVFSPSAALTLWRHPHISSHRPSVGCWTSRRA